MRGSLEGDVLVELTIYRIHEVIQVYGNIIKALIDEEYGGGIISAITFNLDIIERIESYEGPRVRITYDSKFLPYSLG